MKIENVLLHGLVQNCEFVERLKHCEYPGQCAESLDHCLLFGICFLYFAFCLFQGVDPDL
jgi:hypothetical protein